MPKIQPEMTLEQRLERFETLRQLSAHILDVIAASKLDEFDTIRFLLGISISGARAAGLPKNIYLAEAEEIWKAVSGPSTKS